jgi:hypothetical protein
MGRTGRRSVLKVLASLPVISWLPHLELFGKGGSEYAQPESRPEYIAVQILRHLNTAQCWHKGDHGHYAELAKLDGSAAMERLLSSEKVEQVGLGKALHEQLRFDHEEIVPGWKLGFAVADDQAHYVVTLSPTENSSLLSMSTDERGVIYYGSGVSSDTLTGMMRAPELVQKKKDFRDRAVSAIRSLAFGFMTCSYCDPFPCACPSCCCTTNSNCAACDCTNCGCDACVWCTRCGCIN